MMNKRSIYPGAVYKYYKGNFYKVIGVAKHTETSEEMVVYISLSDSDHYGALWVRPLSIFCEDVKVDGETVPRFTLVLIH